MALNILNVIDNTILRFFDIRLSPQARQITSMLIMGGIITLILGAGYWGYGFYASSREKDAQKTLASCIELYEQASSEKAPASAWTTVETACKRGHEEYTRSALAPYFLSYQAEALIKQNKIDEAIIVMTQMVDSMFKSSPLYYIYATKLALVQMDATDSAVHTAGLKRLEELSVDTHNEQRDEALYYVGLYYWHQNDTAKAKEAWSKLAELPAKSQDHVSPWMQLVSERLAVLA